MALVKCPECKTQVSDKADKCPKCAYPINNKTKSTNKVKVEEVQFTKKKHKKSMIWAALMGIIGFILLFNEKTIIYGLILLAVTIIYSVIIKIRVFWDHD